MVTEATAAQLRTGDGSVIPLALERWHLPPSAEEHALLARVGAPVLDVGCGPGRHVLALAQRGVMALGVDASPTAAGLARARGAPVLERSIFDRIPGACRWGSALLLDGNIGIGGNPPALLGRISRLLRRGGAAFVEVEPPGVTTRVLTVRLERGERATAWFPWAVVGVGDVATLAGDAGLHVADAWEDGGRWFAELVRD